MVEIIEFLTSLIFSAQRGDLRIALVEGLTEAAKKFGHGQIGLIMSPINGRIDEGGKPGTLPAYGHVITSPEIAVQEAGERVFRNDLSKADYEPLNFMEKIRPYMTAFFGKAELIPEALFSKEADPIVAGTVRLGL